MRSLPTNREVLNREYLRRSLVDQIRVSGLNSLTENELASLHELDKLNEPFDIVGIMYEEIALLERKLELCKEQRDMLISDYCYNIPDLKEECDAELAALDKLNETPEKSDE